MDDYKDPEWIAEIKRRYPMMFQGIDLYNFGCDDGWRSILEELCANLAAMELPALRILQIKEKFGGLRVYVRGGNAAVNAEFRKAVGEAAKTCEVCGAPGVIDQRSAEGPFRWVKTLCAPCRAARDHKKRTP
jgi:hypothetical protein